MNTPTDDETLAALKKYWPSLASIIADVETLQEAEKLLIPHCGGVGAVALQVRQAREAALRAAPNDVGSIVGG